MRTLGRAIGRVGVCLLLGSCGDDDGFGVDPETDTEGDSTTFPTTFPETTTEPGTGETTTGQDTSSTTAVADASSGTGFDPPRAECGNGFVEEGEQCDDGNLDDGDECSSSCQIPCGLEWSAIVLPVTAQSTIDPVAVVRGPDGQVVAVALQREITLDQKGNETVGPNEAAVAAFGAEGDAAWDVRLPGPAGALQPRDAAIDDAGDVYIAGDVDSVAGDGDIFVTKLSGDNGSELWTHVHDSAVDTAEDLATGIAVAPDGNPVVSGQVRAGDGDDDVFLRKLDTADGTEVWTSTWSGVGTATFSTDDGGPIAVASDGTVYVLATEYLSFQAQPMVLLQFPADGGDPQWVHTFEFGGSEQQFQGIDLETGPQGDVYAVFVRLLAAGSEYHLRKLAPDETELWSATQADYIQSGNTWIIDGVAPTQTGEVVVGGTFFDVETVPRTSILSAWVQRTDADGEPLCAVQQAGPQEGLLPADLDVLDVTSAADGGAILVADFDDEGAQAMWLGRFRPE